MKYFIDGKLLTNEKIINKLNKFNWCFIKDNINQGNYKSRYINISFYTALVDCDLEIQTFNNDGIYFITIPMINTYALISEYYKKLSRKYLKA